MQSPLPADLSSTTSNHDHIVAECQLVSTSNCYLRPSSNSSSTTSTSSQHQHRVIDHISSLSWHMALTSQEVAMHWQYSIRVSTYVRVLMSPSPHSLIYPINSYIINAWATASLSRSINLHVDSIYSKLINKLVMYILHVCMWTRYVGTAPQVRYGWISTDGLSFNFLCL